MGKRFKQCNLVLVFWGLSILETLITIIILLRIPADPKNAVIAGFSALRLATFAGLGVLLVALAVFGAGSLRYSAVNGFWTSAAQKIGKLFIPLLVGAAVLAWLLMFPPPFLQGERLERVGPLLALFLLIAVQGAGLIWLRQRAQARAAVAGVKRWFEQAQANSWIGWGLLAFSAAISASVMFFSYYNMGDEGDTLAVGWFLSHGDVLYRDTFSHHFPLSYLWAALVAKLFGPSITAARASLVVLRLAVLAWTMRASRQPMAVGLTAAAWSLIGPLYLGNMLLYHAFSSLFICSAFLVIFSALIEDSWDNSFSRLLSAGGMAGLAVLADPLMVIPAGLLVVFAGLSGLRDRRSGWREVVRRAGAASAGGGLIGLAFLAYLVMTGSLDDFIHSALLFNSQVYSRYTPVDVGLAGYWDALTRALHLFDPAWRVETSPYFGWYSYLELDRWLFTGFFYRFAVLAGCAIWLLRGKRLVALFLYSFAAALLIRAGTLFHAAPFVLAALVSSALALVGRYGRSDAQPGKRSGRGAQLAVPFLTKGLALLVFIMFFWLAGRAGVFLSTSRSQMTWSANFEGLAGDAGYYQQMTCHRPEARLLIYPLDSMGYYFARILPASEYSFMTPWVADIAQQEVIREIRNQPVLVYINKDQDIWGYPVKEYLSDLIAFLDEEFTTLEPNVYRSPALDALCE